MRNQAHPPTPRGRRTHPLVRDSPDEPLRRAGGEESLDRTPLGLERNRGAFGLPAGAHTTNETTYVAQAFARVVMGTHDVDSCDRACPGDTLTPRSACRLCVVEVAGPRPWYRPVPARPSPAWRSARTPSAPGTAAGPSSNCSPPVSTCRPPRGSPGGSRSTEPDRTASARRRPASTRSRGPTTTCMRATTTSASSATAASTPAAAGRRTPSRSASPAAASPPGSLSFRSEFGMRAAGTWDESRQTATPTVCAHRGVGCGLTLHVQDNEIVKVTAPHDDPVARGNLCIKGRFGHQHGQNRD